LTQERGKQREILAAAGRVFGQYGLRKTTIGDVVREAGVARATLYKHFATKEDLFRAVVEKEMREVLEEDRRAVAAAETSREKLRAFVNSHADMIRRTINLSRMSIDELSDLYPKDHWREHEMVAEAQAIVSGILEAGIAAGEIARREPDGRPLAILLAFKTLFLGVATRQLGEEETRALGDQLIELIYEGLRAREEAA